MSASKETYQGMLSYVSLGIGTLFTAALLYNNSTNTAAIMVLNLGEGIASWANLTGFFPALFTASLIGGLILLLVVSAIAPKLENYVAMAGKTRARALLQTKEGMTVEEERKELIRIFGQKKPS